MLPRYKRQWQHICAMMPAYLDDGTNGTVITYLDGTQETVAHRLCWVLDDLLHHLHTSRDALVKSSRAYLGKQARRVPLIASADFCLVPVKGRSAFTGNESLVGYIVMNHVTDVLPSGTSNLVYFDGGTSIAVLDHISILWANLNLTKELKQDLEQNIATPY